MTTTLADLPDTEQIWFAAKLTLLLTQGDCLQCIGYNYQRWGPGHLGFPWCRSGSIASGGTKAHCTCDSCF